MLELRTIRTRLTPFAEEDAEELLALFRNPGVRRYLLDDMEVSPEWVATEIVNSSFRFADSGTGLCSVRFIGDTRIIGFVGFREFFEPPQLQLLYGLLPEYWGQGLATEVSARICEYAFNELEFSEILAAIDTPNKESRAVLQRLQFEEATTAVGVIDGTTFFRLTREKSSNLI